MYKRNIIEDSSLHFYAYTYLFIKFGSSWIITEKQFRNNKYNYVLLCSGGIQILMYFSEGENSTLKISALEIQSGDNILLLKSLDNAFFTYFLEKLETYFKTYQIHTLGP